MLIARWFLGIAALLGGLAVGLGAFASHGLREQLSDRALAIFETGVRYQMYHALALLLVGLWLSRAEAGRSLLTSAGIAYCIGVLFFSGSLYALSLSNIKLLGAVAPLGGVAFLVGWSCLAIAAFTFK